MQQYFISSLISENQKIELEPGQLHHITHVLRMKDNATIRVVDAEQKACYARVRYINSEALILFDRWIEQDQKQPKIILVQALIKKDKWELVLQKAAELGADEIYPLQSKRTVVKADSEKGERKLARWNTICKEACEQSHRIQPCIVHEPITIKDLAKLKQDVNLLCYEKENVTHYISDYIAPTDSVLIAIGPEGGWDLDEVSQMENMGFSLCSLGRRILRAETASMYALTVIDAVREG